MHFYTYFGLLLSFLLTASCNKKEMTSYSNESNQIVGSWHTEVIDGKGNTNIIRAEYGTNGKYYFSESVINADDDIVHIGTYTIIGSRLRRVLNGVTEEVSYKIVDGMLYEVNGGKEKVFKRQTEQAAPSNR